MRTRVILFSAAIALALLPGTASAAGGPVRVVDCGSDAARLYVKLVNPVCFKRGAEQNGGEYHATQCGPKNGGGGKIEVRNWQTGKTRMVVCTTTRTFAKSVVLRVWAN